jgi:hypothetical protein
VRGRGKLLLYSLPNVLDWRIEFYLMGIGDAYWIIGRDSSQVRSLLFVVTGVGYVKSSGYIPAALRPSSCNCAIGCFTHGRVALDLLCFSFIGYKKGGLGRAIPAQVLVLHYRFRPCRTILITNTCECDNRVIM